MMDVDFERVSMLLSIVKDIPGTLPQMTHISSAAAAEIKEINDQLKGEAQTEAKRLAEEASVAKAAELRAVDPNPELSEPMVNGEPELVDADDTPNPVPRRV